MRDPTDPALERAETEAALFLLLLSETPDDADLRARCAEWQAADPQHAKVWARTTRAYALLGQIGPSVAPTRSAMTHQPVQPQRHMLSRRRLGATAVVTAMAASAAISFAPDLLLRLSGDIVTRTAELRTVTLADGSEVNLAPNSALALAFTADQRRVHLLRGEAFFSVTRDTARPFSVIAGQAAVTVLGTAFDVRWTRDGLAVAVRRGHVRVDDGRARPPIAADLLAGDWLRLTWAGGLSRGQQSPDDVADWRQGQLVARDRPIGDIVDSLRGYYHGEIIVEDHAFAARHVTGLYDLHQPEDTLRALAAAHGATVRALSPWILLVTRS